MNNSGVCQSYCSAVRTLAKIHLNHSHRGSRWQDQVTGSRWHQICPRSDPVGIKLQTEPVTFCRSSKSAVSPASDNSCQESRLYTSLSLPLFPTSLSLQHTPRSVFYSSNLNPLHSPADGLASSLTEKRETIRRGRFALHQTPTSATPSPVFAPHL